MINPKIGEQLTFTSAHTCAAPAQSFPSGTPSLGENGTAEAQTTETLPGNASSMRNASVLSSWVFSRLASDRWRVEDHGYDTPCWVWRGNKDRGGYGVLTTHYRRRSVTRRAHRVAYEQNVGPIPEGLELDHLCRVRACVNPDHLEPVTRGQNQQRSIQAKLDWDKVHEIRDNPQISASEFSRRFGVSLWTVSQVRRNNRWVEEGS